jgi:hypothetical protein
LITGHSQVTDAENAQDEHARFVLRLISSSQKEIDRVALSHQEALLNSMGAGHDEYPVTHDNPYGDPFGLVRAYFADKAISDIISPFSAEQTSAITTKMVAPLIAQREVLYVEANGTAEEARKARIRERLWERCIRGPYTNWSLAMWQAYRDMVVRSRGFIEVAHCRVVEKRRVYAYNPVKFMVNMIMSGFMKMLGTEGAGTIRVHDLKEVTLWDGPIIRALPFGTVFRDPSEACLSNNSRWVAIKYQMTRGEIEDIAGKLFDALDPTVTISFEPEMLDLLGHSPDSLEAKKGVVTSKAQHDVATIAAPPIEYDPYDVIVWKGQDPAADPNTRWIYWVVQGKCIGAKEHDGSGSWNNIIELAWDPMSDFATSMSPIMMIRRIQEMDSMLMSNALDASTWESHPGGFVNELVVNDVEQVRNLRPAEYMSKMGEGAALERVQLGGNAMATFQEAATIRDVGRAATGGLAAVVGVSPVGSDTATEFSGLSAGAIGRLEMQQEINSELGLKRMYNLVIASFRDNIQDDETLKKLIGDDGTLGTVTLEDLEDDMECIPMAARFQVIRQAELQAIKGLMMQAQIDPYLQAKLKKEELYDDFVYASAGGPRGWRWAKTSKEMRDQGMSPEALEQLQVQNSAQAGASAAGQPSQPSLPSAQPSTQIQPTQPGVPPGGQGG